MDESREKKPVEGQVLGGGRRSFDFSKNWMKTTIGELMGGKKMREIPIR